MSYLSNTDTDRRKMLDKIGAGCFEDIIADIPEALRLDRPLDITALSEMEVLAEIGQMSRDNGAGKTCFAGGGVYDHFIPSAVRRERCKLSTSFKPTFVA
jgi:glycine dehydrogenase subunit 1